MTLPNLQLHTETRRRGWSRDQAKHTHIQSLVPFFPSVKQAYMPTAGRGMQTHFQQHKTYLIINLYQCHDQSPTYPKSTRKEEKTSISNLRCAHWPFWWPRISSLVHMTKQSVSPQLKNNPKNPSFSATCLPPYTTSSMHSPSLYLILSYYFSCSPSLSSSTNTHSKPSSHQLAAPSFLCWLSSESPWIFPDSAFFFSFYPLVQLISSLPVVSFSSLSEGRLEIHACTYNTIPTTSFIIIILAALLENVYVRRSGYKSHHG